MTRALQLLAIAIALAAMLVACDRIVDLSPHDANANVPDTALGIQDAPEDAAIIDDSFDGGIPDAFTGDAAPDA